VVGVDVSSRNVGRICLGSKDGDDAGLFRSCYPRSDLLSEKCALSRRGCTSELVANLQPLFCIFSAVDWFLVANSFSFPNQHNLDMAFAEPRAACTMVCGIFGLHRYLWSATRVRKHCVGRRKSSNRVGHLDFAAKNPRRTIIRLDRALPSEAWPTNLDVQDT